jgi:hypothetical protein
MDKGFVTMTRYKLHNSILNDRTCTKTKYYRIVHKLRYEGGIVFRKYHHNYQIAQATYESGDIPSVVWNGVLVCSDMELQ